MSSVNEDWEGDDSFMDDEDNAYEAERQKTILENRALLDSLGLDPNGASKLPVPQSKPRPSASRPKKRKVETVKVEEGPRRRSGRLAGLEAEGEELAKRAEAEEKEREVLRVVNRKTREQVMPVQKMVEATSPNSAAQLEGYLTEMTGLDNPRKFPEASTSGKEAYAESDTVPAEVQRLKAAFKGMVLSANTKVTPERVYSMVVHPEKTKTLVCVGDKYGMLGLWDALGPAGEKAKDEDGEEAEEDDGQGRVWHVQAHARNSITAMKVDPVDGAGLFSSSYDCSLRHLDFRTLTSTELFSFPDEDTLINHFDLTPDGKQAWMSDKNGGLSHCDFREGRTQRRRWIVQEEGRAAKLGGISVNPLMPHLLVTAGNDGMLRIWDTRHLTVMTPRATETVAPPTPPPSRSKRHSAANEIKKEHGAEQEATGDPTAGESDTAAHINTQPESVIPYDKVQRVMESTKGKGLLRASWKHGKSCSAAYWDPWGRRVLTTSYDDKLRVWSLNPQSLLLDQPLSPSSFQPTRSIPHNCQTGRWLTILRANWSLNTEYMPHFTVGNMKRSLDVVAASGDKIVQLWTDDVTAVPAVTASHPSRVDHVVGGNTSGRIQLWTSGAT